MEHADYDFQRYHDALYDNFDLRKVYTSNEVIGIVGDVRRDLRMEPYITRLRTNCLSDFYGLFIVQDETEEEIVDGQIKKKVVGYKPVFRLKPEDLD
ncbi:MAG TPA: hypothetical protein VG367_19455 [Mucilaginibacter sp.]|nr:hypothetical protein [Mucilaginibacter sp.]